jgi:hypothetical protein
MNNIQTKVNEIIRNTLEAEGYSLSSNDWMGATKSIHLLYQKEIAKERKEIYEKLFKELIREEGHPIDRDFPVESWEKVDFIELDKILRKVLLSPNKLDKGGKE